MSNTFGAAAGTVRGQTLADLLVPPGGRAAVRAGALVVGGAALTALAAPIAFHVPWTPVPYTGQTAAVLLAGTALGWRLGSLSMVLYLLAGAVGLPVYSAGAHGLDQLFGYTGGYLVAFVLAGALVGALAERGWDRSPLRAGLLMLAGTVLIYVIGVPVLAVTLEMSPGDAAWNGALVFLPWDALKVLLAAGLLPAAWRIAGTRR